RRNPQTASTPSPVSPRSLIRDKAVAVESDELPVQIGNLGYEGRDQLPLGPLPDMRGSEGVDDPPIILAVDNGRADAHDGMVDVLREFVAIAARTSASVLPASPLAAAKPWRSGTVSRSQTMTACFHRRSVAQVLGIEETLSFRVLRSAKSIWR